MRARRPLVAIALLLALSVQAAQPDLGTDAQRASGAKLYARYCSQCHGDKGDGKGEAAAHLDPLPRDFTTGKYKIRTTPSGTLPTQEDLENVIRRGMPYTAMPPWPQLTDDEIRDLAYHVKSFHPGFADASANADPIEIPSAPDWSEESAAAGRKVYESIGCIACHGNLGRGDGPSAPSLRDDAGAFLRPADLSMRWTFRGGPTREDVFRTFSTGLNGTPMPSFADSLKPEERWQLVDYIASLGGAGEESDRPNYSEILIARRVAGEIDLNAIGDAFDEAKPARFPIVGQIMEPGRQFASPITSVVVRAIYNDETIAFLVSWHDMSAQRTGANGPALPVSRQDEVLARPAAAAATPGTPSSGDDFWGTGAAEEEAAPAAAADDFWGEAPPADTKAAAAPTAQSEFSDAVAIQLPLAMPTGIRRPYFLFGDAQAPVDLWFLDVANPRVQRFTAQGSATIAPAELESLQAAATYADGEWTAVFTRKLRSQTGVTFAADTFVPIAFSTWDGFSRERGNRRGLTLWWNVYLEPAEGPPSPLRGIATTVLGVLGLELLAVALIRRRYSAGART